MASAAVLCSGAMFAYHCYVGALEAASWQPLLLYGGVLAFLLLPANALYRVRAPEPSPPLVGA